MGKLLPSVAAGESLFEAGAGRAGFELARDGRRWNALREKDEKVLEE
jgi:hypothetical protein